MVDLNVHGSSHSSDSFLGGESVECWCKSAVEIDIQSNWLFSRTVDIRKLLKLTAIETDCTDYNFAVTELHSDLTKKNENKKKKPDNKTWSKKNNNGWSIHDHTFCLLRIPATQNTAQHTQHHNIVYVERVFVVVVRPVGLISLNTYWP